MAVHYVIGDVHGCLRPLLRLLQREGLIDENLAWSGGQAHLWFLGDYTDRGPDGLGVIEFIMHLEQSAQATGGGVHGLLGNHDLMLLAARRFGDVEVPSFRRQGYRMTFYEIWRRVGGVEQDLERLNETHIRWLQARPALARVENTLLMHSDSLFYLDWGDDLEQINRSVQGVLHSGDVDSWDALAEQFTTRFAFLGGLAPTEAFLGQLGAHRLVHGHTPVYSLIGVPPETVLYPLEYNDGLCVNVDPGLWKGGPGFAFLLSEGGG